MGGRTGQRSRKVWSAKADRIFVDLWQKKLPELSSVERKGDMVAVLSEMAEYMTARGHPVSVTEVRYKQHNLFLKYKKYQAVWGKPHCSLPPWDLYEKVGRLIAAKRAKTMLKNNIANDQWDELCTFNVSSQKYITPEPTALGDEEVEKQLVQSADNSVLQASSKRTKKVRQIGRNIMTSKEDKMFVDLWQSKLVELSTAPLKKVVYKEMAEYMTAMGKEMSPRDVRYKLANLFVKYKKYKAVWGKPNCHLKPWVLFEKVGRLAAATRAKTMCRNNANVEWEQQSSFNFPVPPSPTELVSVDKVIERPHKNNKNVPTELGEEPVETPTVRTSYNGALQTPPKRLSAPRKHLKKMRMTAKEDRIFVDLWQSKLGELCTAPRKVVVFKKMAESMTAMGKVMSAHDVRCKITNLIIKYKKYQSAMSKPSGPPRPWALYEKVGSLITAKRIKLEKDGSWDVQTESNELMPISASLSVNEYSSENGCIEPAQLTSLSEDMKLVSFESNELVANSESPPLPEDFNCSGYTPPSLADLVTTSLPERTSSPLLLEAKPAPPVECIQSSDEPTVVTSPVTRPNIAAHADALHCHRHWAKFPKPFESIPPPAGYVVSFVEPEQPRNDQSSAEEDTALRMPPTAHTKPETTLELCVSLLQKFEQAMATNTKINEERSRADREILQIMKDMRDDCKRLTDGFLQFFATNITKNEKNAINH